MHTSCTNDTVGLLLGALAVRDPHHETATLSMLHANLEQAGFVLAREELVAASCWLSEKGTVITFGDLQVAESARVALVRRPRVVVPFDRVAGRFVLGTLSLYGNSPVQVSQIRQAAERVWPKDEVFLSLYLAIAALVNEGKLASHSRGGDPDQLMVALIRDVALLA